MLVAMFSRKIFVTTLQAMLAFVVLTPFALSETRPKPPKSVRLYVFDNGMITGLDPAAFHLLPRSATAFPCTNTQSAAPSL